MKIKVVPLSSPSGPVLEHEQEYNSPIPTWHFAKWKCNLYNSHSMCSSADSSPPESRSIRLMVAKQTVTEAGPPHNQFWKLTSNPNFPRKIHWQDRCTDVGWHGSAPLNLSQPLHQIGIWPRTTHTHGEESDQNDNQRTRERERERRHCYCQQQGRTQSLDLVVVATLSHSLSLSLSE